MQALMDTRNIERSIEEVAQLYRSLTGTEIKHDPNRVSEIPPETDPLTFVSERLGELQRLLGGAPVPGPSQDTLPSWAPPVDLLESEHELVVVIDVPGIQPSELSVSVVNHTLIVKGDRSRDRLTQGFMARGTERVQGPFQRLIPLPAGARVETVNARLQDGVLTIHVEREGAQQRIKKVEVRELSERSVKQ